jgi:hypothetical protein
LGDFGLQFVKFLLDDVLIIRKVGLQPFEGASIVFGLEILLEFVQLLIGHLVGQPDADPHLQRLVDVLEEAIFLDLRQAAEADFF